MIYSINPEQNYIGEKKLNLIMSWLFSEKATASIFTLKIEFEKKIKGLIPCRRFENVAGLDYTLKIVFNSPFPQRKMMIQG